MADAVYWKDRTTYANGDKTDYKYTKLTKYGEITRVSPSKHKITHPTTFYAGRDFVMLDKEDFDKVYKEVEESIEYQIQKGKQNYK